MKKIILFLCVLMCGCKAMDTPTVPQVTPEAAGLSLSYIQDWQKLYVNATKIQGTSCSLKLFDTNNKLIHENTSATHPPFFTAEINTSALAAGTYIINLKTELETVTINFVKQ